MPSDADLHVRALAYLRTLTENPQAEFREGQYEAIHAIVAERKRLLLVQRTGWGKSAVYFIATKLLRDTGRYSTAIMISPLLSLMRNQVFQGQRLLDVETLNSSNRGSWPAISARMDNGQLDMLIISPERLADDRFFLGLLLPSLIRPALVIVDEAHCISDWGHDFRPDYQRIARILSNLSSPALGTTATANDRVIDDVRDQLGASIGIERGPLGRDSLLLQTINLPRVVDRLGWLSQYLEKISGSGIIYALTVRDALLISDWLQSRDPRIVAPAYHAGLADEERVNLEQKLLRNEVKCLVATIALGMGFDKPDLGFVIHFQRPQSAIHYYQQIGRAGRAVEKALAILLSGDEDDDIIDYFISAPMAYHAYADRIYAILSNSQSPLTKEQIGRTVNIRIDLIENVLKRMAVMPAAPIDRAGNLWTATGNPFEHDRARSAEIAETRRRERDRLRDYLHSTTCLMEFLQRELNDHNARPCGRCAICVGHPLVPASVSPAIVQAAQFFLESQAGIIESGMIKPKLGWPRGSSTLSNMTGRIPAGLRTETGRVLATWASPGIGELVKHGKAAGKFDDRLIDAAATLIQSQWNPQPQPTWVTCVPSRRNRGTVPEAAARLASRLGLPYVACVSKVTDNPPQKDMQNVFHQIRNLDGAFEVDLGEVRSGPVLLVDDIVDSGWTLAVVGAMLREAGSGQVHPFTFGRTTPR